MTLEQLQAERASLPSLLDVVGARAQEEIYIRRRVLDARINAARSAASVVAGVDGEIAPRIKWRDHLIEWRPKLAEQLLACPSRSTNRQEEHTQRGLEISIAAIDRGFPFATEMYPPNLPLFALMTAAGYVAPSDQPWNIFAAGFGSLPAVERRLTELQKRRDVAQDQMDSALREPVSV